MPSKYIEFVNRDENIDYDTKMRALQEELTDLLKQEEQSKQDLLAVFKELVYYQAHTLWPFVIFSHIFCDFSLDIINILHLQCVTVSGSRYMNAGEF